MRPEDVAAYLAGLSRRETQQLLDAVEDAVGGYRKPVVCVLPVEEWRTSNPPGFISVNPPGFDVVLHEAGPSRLETLKVLRKITGLPLREAKALLDAAPVTVQEELYREDAEASRARLEATGARVSLR